MPRRFPTTTAAVPDHPAGIVHVWVATYDIGPDDFLSPEEEARSASFRFERDRRTWRHAHNALRRALSRTCPERAPRDWQMAVQPGGKPFVVGTPSPAFSIAHARSCYAVAVGPVALGVDLERFGHIGDQDDLMDLVAHPAEREWYRRSGADEDAFLTLWTRKEALLKATGEGLVDRLEAIWTDPAAGEAATRIARGDGNYWLFTRRWDEIVVSLAVCGSGDIPPSIQFCDAADL